MCLLAVAAVISASLQWYGAPRADRLTVRVAGRPVGEWTLDQPQVVRIQGVLGETRLEIQPGRARIAADPGRRQYCVQQGWLERAGAVAICAPNQVTVMLSGPQARYDSLGY